jgi:hypothetical protein
VVTTTSAAIADFEVYLLMTMKPRLALADTQGLLDAKLTKAGLSISDASRISDRIAEALNRKASRFRPSKHPKICLGRMNSIFCSTSSQAPMDTSRIPNHAGSCGLHFPNCGNTGSSWTMKSFAPTRVTRTGSSSESDGLRLPDVFPCRDPSWEDGTRVAMDYCW